MQDPMPIDNLSNPVPVDVKKKKFQRKKVVGKKKPKKTKIKKRRTIKADLQDHYNVLSAITNAPSGLTFGHLWQGDAVSAKKELDSIFGRDMLKLEMMKENVEHHNSEME